MSVLGEDAKPQWGSVLAEGVNTVSANQTVTFVRYVRTVLPLDGSVFWVKANLLSPSALAAGSPPGALRPGEPRTVLAPAATITAQGSLHFSSIQTMQEDENYDNNQVVFTSLVPIPALGAVQPQEMWLGTFPGESATTMRFSFSARSSYYQQADLHHYTGDAVYSIMETQIVDSVDQLQALQVVVSNSLPFWLTLSSLCPIFPSFLVPDNQPPPYVSVHIDPAATQALQTLPVLDADGSHWQLAQDHVKLTSYGLRNFSALDFLDAVLERIGYDGDPVGLTSGVIVADEKMTQVEIGTIAQKKSMVLDVSYYQSRIRQLAQSYILSCIPNFIVQDI